MPAIMRILGWRAEGLRCPDQEIDCCDTTGTPHVITLIQMPNGTGKTTTLQLLRAVLSGSAEDWPPDDVRDYRKRNSKSNTGQFELRLLLNDSRVTIIAFFDFEVGRVLFKTTRSEGQTEGFEPPIEFRRFMDKNFVNFYIFDGELAENLLKKEHTHAEQVVEHLFQLDVFGSMKERISGYWDSKTQEKTAKKAKGFSRRKNRLNILRKRLVLLGEKKEKKEEQLAGIESSLKKKKQQFEMEISKQKELSQQLHLAEGQVVVSKGELREKSRDVLDIMRDPNALSPQFASEMRDLKTGLDRVKLPESAAREFFEELAEENECVCGRPIDEDTRRNIKKRAERYLGSDDTAFLNSMKSAIEDALSGPEFSENLEKGTRELDRLEQQFRSAMNDRDTFKREAENADPAVKEATDQIDNFEEQYRQCKGELDKYDSLDDQRGDEDTFGIEIIKRRLEDAERKLAEITHTMELKEKRNLLMDIISKSHQKASESIMAGVCSEANTRIQKLMPHNDIEIDRIDRCLVLRGQGGGSAGETLSVGYAFLASLFTHSAHKLPFVVDSPAGPIDLDIRPKIAELIPKLSEQFLAFTISSEREQFVGPLKQAATSPINYQTLFRKGVPEVEEQARTIPTHVETNDGFCVPGEKFFRGFQLDSED